VSALLFIKDLLVATFGQLASLFGGIVVFGLLIQFISQLTFRSLENAFGRKGVYFVAWLGTPVHELGHALFCLIFFHRIVEIRFFKPDPVYGTLGYVKHAWHRTNPWQMLGNFFIGVGPLLLGCGVLFGLFYFLIPDSSRAWESIVAAVSAPGRDYTIGSYFTLFSDSALVLVKLVFTTHNLTTAGFWIFIYLSICVASNIRLSLADLKISFTGLGCVVLPFLVLNLAGMIWGFSSKTVLPLSTSSLGVVYSLLILALIMALLGFLAIYVVCAVYVRVTRKRFLSPF